MKCFIFKYSKVKPENTISVNFGVWETETETEKETERDRETGRQTETETERDRERQRQSYICQVIGL